MMKRIKFAVALLIIAFNLNAQTGLDEGKKLIVNENYGEARKVLNQYVTTEKDPLKQAEAYYWLGECDYRDLIEEQPAKAQSMAKEQYNKGIVLAKNSPHCQVGMGKLLLDAKNGKEALKVFEAAIKDSRKKPYKEGHPEIYMLIGDTYLNCTQKNPEQAVANYTRARDIEPKDANFSLKLGDGQLAKGDAGSAMNAFESASQKDKNNADVYLKMARIWKRASKYELALENLNNGLKVNSNYAPIYKDKIELLMLTQKFNEVLPTLEKYIPLAGNDFSARRRLVTFLTYQAKDYDRAIVEAEKLLKDDPTQTTMYRWLAWSESSKADTLVARNKNVMGDDAKMLYQKAQDDSKKLFETVPADRLVYYDYDFAAKSAARIGDLESATKYYRKEIELDSIKRCDILSNLTQAHYDAKKFKEGLDLFDERVSVCELKTAQEKNLAYFYATYYAFALVKDYDRTIKYADKYIELFPTTITGHYYKAEALNEKDDENAPKFIAKESYEKVISVYEAKPDDRSKPQAEKAYNYIATFYGSQQDLVKAKEFYAKTLALNPNNRFAKEQMEKLGP